jgi:hypothetical protein
MIFALADTVLMSFADTEASIFVRGKACKLISLSLTIHALAERGFVRQPRNVVIVPSARETLRKKALSYLVSRAQATKLTFQF